MQIKDCERGCAAQMENEQCGAFVGDKAKMRLQGCQSTCNRSDGFCAEKGGSLKLSRCTSDSDRCALVCYFYFLYLIPKILTQEIGRVLSNCHNT